jgi:hypothetical protein
VDPTVVLGMMIAAIRQVSWSVDLVRDRLVWPGFPASARRVRDTGLAPKDRLPAPGTT